MFFPFYLLNESNVIIIISFVGNKKKKGKSIMKKLSAIFSTVLVAILIYSFPNYAEAKVMWGKTELVEGQIGKVTVLKKTGSFTLNGNTAVGSSRVFKKGEEFRVYSFKEDNNKGYYGLGGGIFLQKNDAVKYETPSKSKLLKLQQEKQASSKVDNKVYASLKKEIETLQKEHTKFSSLLNNGKIADIDINFYPFDNSIKILEFKVKKLNSKDAKAVTDVYIKPAIETRTKAVYKVSDYRQLTKAKNLLNDRKIDSAIKEFTIYENNKKKLSNKPSNLNQMALNEISVIENAISKELNQIALEERMKNNKGENVVVETKLSKYHFKIVAAPSISKEEVKQYEDYAKLANESVIEEFGYLGGIEKLLEAGFTTIHVLDEPTSKAGPGMWLIETSSKGSDLYFLAKSAHKVKCCTNTGKDFDDIYFKGTMIHELDTIVLGGLVGNKSRGWDYFWSAPEWFVQGYEDYLGAKYANDHDKVNTLITRAINNGSLKIEPNGLTAEGRYNDGLVALQFFHEFYGKEKIHKALLSEEPTFDKALEKEIGDWKKISHDFKTWVNNK